MIRTLAKNAKENQESEIRSIVENQLITQVKTIMSLESQVSELETAKNELELKLRHYEDL